VVHITLLSTVLIAAAVEAGFKVQPIFRLFMVFFLCVIGLIIFFRPYIPGLPFKVGQTVKAAGLLGKVEATTFLNTRIRTFDGKVFFVPNKTILNDVVINYGYTPTRRMKIDIPIRYDQDLMKAKQVLEALMIEDPRVQVKPRPAVWVLDLSNGCIMLGGRCWAENLKYWQTRVDLVEKAKLRFDQEGIRISYPHLGVHHYPADIEDAEALHALASVKSGGEVPNAAEDEM
jgi:small conductance mechanosensitive channel